jgi:hypothetical protein
MEVVMREFENHPDADIFIFHFDTDSERKQIKYKKTKKCGRFSRQPWGGVRIAFRLSSVKKANINFTTLFGGGCIFPSGEDSMWLCDAKRKGLVFYVSKETIGTVSFDHSTWFTGYDQKFFYGKGACSYAIHGKSFGAWKWYLLFRYRNAGTMSFFEKLQWMDKGKEGYKRMLDYYEFCKRKKECKK